MIEVRGLRKAFGARVAVDDVSFEAPDGAVTALLGPNGSGKSTTLRCALGLVRPDAGSATIDGRALARWPEPLRRVGALLEPRAFHPARSAYRHLRGLAIAAGIGAGRVDEVLDLVGLAEVADRRAGTFSLGMAQRLGLATALLGDPSTLVLDEPTNGLDAGGVAWVHALCRSLAHEGRAVVLASHHLGELDALADRVVVLGRGRVILEASVPELEAQHGSVADAYAAIAGQWVEFGADPGRARA